MTARGTRCECRCHFRNHGKGAPCDNCRRRNPLPRTKAEQRAWDQYLYRRDVGASRKRDEAAKDKARACRAETKAARDKEQARRKRLRAVAARSRARELAEKEKAARCRAERRAVALAEKETRREHRARRARAARRRREAGAGPGVSSAQRAAEKRREAVNEARYHFEATAPELVALFDQEAHRFKGTNGNQIREQFTEWVESWGQKEYAAWLDDQMAAGARELERLEAKHYAEAVPF